jgi:glycosyltransferase involved in cell wall biosynthesis
MKPSISVIMSVFNNDNLVKKSIESILNQSFQNFEFIIIDDGSTDNSKKIIKLFEKKNKKIRFYSFKKNEGLAKRLNFAIKKSKGKYIARMDADDFSKKKRLQVQKDFLDKNDNFLLIGSNAIYINKNNKFIKKTNLPIDYKDIKKSIYIRNSIIHSSILARKSFFLKNKYNPKFKKCQDYELWLRTIKNYKFKNLKVPLIKRYHSENFNLENLSYSIISRFYNLKILNLHLVFYGSFIETLSYFKLLSKKIFL